MTNANHRPILGKEGHPINSGKYTICTHRINMLLKEMHTWLINRTLGAIITGQQRLGKTQAMDFVIHMIEKQFKGAVIIKVPCRYEKSCTEKSFFSYLLLCIDHALHEVKRCDPSVLRHRLNEHLKMKVENSNYPWVLLFIDDAQRLNENQYAWLMDIHNELKSCDIHLGCYLFGQPELLHQKSAFLMAKKTHLVSRFMVNEFKFQGILSVDEMEFCLMGYDLSEFPLGSGWTFTAYFFPDAYSAGWKLASLALPFWEAFLHIAALNSMPEKLNIPMEYFTRAVERLFRCYENRAVHVENFTHTQLLEVIYFTNFHHYCEKIQSDAHELQEK